MSKIDSREAGISTAKAIFNAVPYVGGVLNEVFFDYRSRVKQERLNRFTELLAEVFHTERDVDVESLKTEEFSDLLESVVRRALQTKSEEKQKRFRDVLTNQILHPTHNFDNSETYLDLITVLSEIEITILRHHTVFDESYEKRHEEYRDANRRLPDTEEAYRRELALSEKGVANNAEHLKQQIETLKDTVVKFKPEFDELETYRTAAFYGVTANEFLYFKQSLYSKGLLIDIGIGRIGMRPFEMMGITEFGVNFIKYIIGPQ